MEGRHSAEFGSLLEEWRLGDLVRAGETVSELMNHPGWEIIADLTQQVHDRTMGQIVIEKPKDPASYGAQIAQRLGFLNGMQCPFDAAVTVLGKAKEAAVEMERGEAELAASERS